MGQTDSLETAIQKELGRVYLCTLEELTALLPQFAPAQISAMVTRLTQEGAIACRSSDASRTILWLPPIRPRRRALEKQPSRGRLHSDDTSLEDDTWTTAVSSSNL
jgi:hypothetical protein